MSDDQHNAQDSSAPDTTERGASELLTEVGPFENSEAVGMLQDIASGEITVDDLAGELLTATGDAYLDADSGAMVVALAHLAKCVSDGRSTDELKLPVEVNPRRFESLAAPSTVEQLRQALEAVLADSTVSGLYAEWEEKGKDYLHAWKAASHVQLRA
ncbi:DUF4259 domain-containing protein [Corynebacterium incognita]|uniref:DUF4259 domain-containing protein n=1 Tax=Corynebacterium incognita TaxID=2754725 RepID=A0A7G7CPG9_9CORY|nr:DUF4259 domain-containing protein [Corynebacterium incognita]QNE89485.1 DUF4259 domain-containing protein [Corynebacterium incognita]